MSDDGARVYQATLVGKDRTQAAYLVLDKSGLTICKQKGNRGKPDLSDVIAQMSFQFVYKLCKACKRSRNAGNPKMLDIVIRSNKGLQELRVQLASANQVRAFRFLVHRPHHFAHKRGSHQNFSAGHF